MDGSTSGTRGHREVGPFRQAPGADRSCTGPPRNRPRGGAAAEELLLEIIRKARDRGSSQHGGRQMCDSCKLPDFDGWVALAEIVIICLLALLASLRKVLAHPTVLMENPMPLWNCDGATIVESCRRVEKRDPHASLLAGDALSSLALGMCAAAAVALMVAALLDMAHIRCRWRQRSAGGISTDCRRLKIGRAHV